MTRTMMIAVLAAGFALPALAEELPIENQAPMSTPDTVTTSSVTPEAMPSDVAAKDHGCMRRKNTALNMM